MVSVQLHSSQVVRMLGTKTLRRMRMMKVREAHGLSTATL